MLLLGLVLLAAPLGSVLEAENLAEQALRDGDRAKALHWLEQGIRRAEDMPTKARLRDRYLAVEWVEPREPAFPEIDTVGTALRMEKLRVWGAAADGFERRGRLHASIRVRQAILDLVGPESRDGKAQAAKVAGIVRKLTERPSKEEQELAHRIARSTANGADLLRKARKLLEMRDYKVAVRICQELSYGDYGREVKDGAAALRKEIEAAARADIPPPEIEDARRVLEDARFGRLDVALSRHFIFLGPEEFVHKIPTNHRTLLDLAYIFQSDLADQNLTFDGVRVLVYYQETFDFGGGLAGGKKIRIGSRAMGVPVAGMLHYHELGHCIFGRGWLHRGFTEGLADFAAGYTLDALGDTKAARDFIVNARTQFTRFYLGRDVAPFRIQPYRPAAGFLFSFLPPGDAPYDWTPFHRVFRRMREAQFGSWPEREHQLMRYFGYLLSTEYGPEVLDLLHSWRFPVSRADERAVPEEVEDLLPDLKRAEVMLMRDLAPQAVPLFRRVLRLSPHSQLTGRARWGLLQAAGRDGDTAEIERLVAELGIVRDFQVLGAFHAKGRTADVVFPPETGPLELGKQVRVGIEAGTWKAAEMTPIGYVNLRKQGYGYPAQACAFAVTYVQVPADTKATIRLGSDDGHLLLVNGELIGKRSTGRFRFDDHIHLVRFRKGWNRVLLKIHNTGGEWGFVLRVTQPDGSPLPEAVFSAEDQEAHVPRGPQKWKSTLVLKEEFRQLSRERWHTGAGKFDTKNGRLRPRDNKRAGLWQRFLVTPDKPKNGPSNILWLRRRALVQADSFELELVLPGDGKALPAQFGLTVDGEGENDGQSGHTLVLRPRGDTVACDWYRYDRLLYHQPGVKLEPAAEYRLLLQRKADKWWLSLNGTPLFAGVSAPRLPAFDLGILTWGAGPEFETLRLARLDPLKP